DGDERLYCEPWACEDVMAIIERERSAGGEVSCVVQFGGQTPLKLALALEEAGAHTLPQYTHCLESSGGRGQHPRRVSRLDRSRGGSPAFLAASLGPRHPAAGKRHCRVA